jgi:hypothetical protein
VAGLIVGRQFISKALTGSLRAMEARKIDARTWQVA